MWHCPHCGAPQAETARCWVCRRSSTTCSTCRHFRASLSTDVSYCALDRRRRPLTGLERRGCWSEQPSSLLAAARLTSAVPNPRARDATAAAPGIPARAFVPVDEVRLERRDAPSEPPSEDGPDANEVPFLVAEPMDGWETRTSLFGDPER